jgi:hypothetical protein
MAPQRTASVPRWVAVERAPWTALGPFRCFYACFAKGCDARPKIKKTPHIAAFFAL